MAGEYVLIGRIVGLYGIKGWLKIESYADPKENIGVYKPWHLNRFGKQVLVQIEAVKLHGKKLVAKLVEIDDRDAAADYLQADILISREQLPELKETEFYWHDLLQLRVLNSSGFELGKVAYLLETGSNDVLVVQDQNRREVLIPYIKGDVITEVDLENGILRVDWEADY